MIVEHGSDELAGDLAAIIAAMKDLGVGAADAVDVVVASARGKAPVRTGNLARSLRGTVSGSTATIGSPVDYGLPVHFGVPARNQRPRPFLHQAVQAETARILDGYTRNVQRVIDSKV